MNAHNTQILYFLFLLSPALASSTNILVFGDFGTGDEKQKLVARDMASYCKSEKCDFALTVGDNIYPAGALNYQILSEIFVSNYKNLNMPIYMSFGNHDIGNEGILSIFKDMFKNQENINKRTERLMMNQLNFTNHADNPFVNSSAKSKRLWMFEAPFYSKEEKEGVHIFAIDTNTYPHQFDFSSSTSRSFGQEAWLKESLHKAKSAWKIVFGHTPLYSHGRHGWLNIFALNNFRNSIIKLLCEERVDFYLSGHDHILEVDKHRCENGHIITAVISGAAAKSEKIYWASFPLFSDDKKLLWANGKFYKNSKLIYKNDDKILGFAHILINGPKALLKLRLSQGSSRERQNACFEIVKSKAIAAVSCD